jgi:hypothetical protein
MLYFSPLGDYLSRNAEPALLLRGEATRLVQREVQEQRDKANHVTREGQPTTPCYAARGTVGKWTERTSAWDDDTG